MQFRGVRLVCEVLVLLFVISFLRQNHIDFTLLLIILYCILEQIKQNQIEIIPVCLYFLVQDVTVGNVNVEAACHYFFFEIFEDFYELLVDVIDFRERRLEFVLVYLYPF